MTARAPPRPIRRARYSPSPNPLPTLSPAQRPAQHAVCCHRLPPQLLLFAGAEVRCSFSSTPLPDAGSGTKPTARHRPSIIEFQLIRPRGPNLTLAFPPSSLHLQLVVRFFHAAPRSFVALSLHRIVRVKFARPPYFYAPAVSPATPTHHIHTHTHIRPLALGGLTLAGKERTAEQMPKNLPSLFAK